MGHTKECIDMAIMSININNLDTLVLEGREGGTPETREEALEWLANGNASCYEPERCDVDY